MTERLLALARATGKINDEGFRRKLRRLSLRPNARLEERLVRKLLREMGNEAFDPPAFRPIGSEQMQSEGVLSRVGHAAKYDGERLVATEPFRYSNASGHRLITGCTRAGKSCFTALMIDALYEDLDS